MIKKFIEKNVKKYKILLKSSFLNMGFVPSPYPYNRYVELLK